MNKDLVKTIIKGVIAERCIDAISLKDLTKNEMVEILEEIIVFLKQDENK